MLESVSLRAHHYAWLESWLICRFIPVPPRYSLVFENSVEGCADAIVCHHPSLHEVKQFANALRAGVCSCENGNLVLQAVLYMA